MMKILVWGTGYYAREIMEERINGDVIGFIETNVTKESFYGKPVFSIDEIPDEWDYIIVANTFGAEIYKKCLERKINMDKIIFYKSFSMQVGCCDLNVLKDVLSEKCYTFYCAERGITQGTKFEEDKKIYTAMNTRENFRIEEENILPFLLDKYYEAGWVQGYFWMDLWAAKLIYKSGVKKHFDIGSRFDGFIAHLLAMDIKVAMIDIRAFPYKIDNLETIIADATELVQIEDNSIESMSALHSIEHFGLGRYGDPIDPEACFKCFDSIQRKLKKGGDLYLALPIGKDRVLFNGAREFTPSTIVNSFNKVTLKEFSYTPGKVFVHDVAIDSFDVNYKYPEGCIGLFHFIKD